VAQVGAGRPARSGWRAYAPELAIVLAAVLYGATFRVVQVSVERTSPSGFVFMRYTVGALVLLPFALRRGWRGPRALPHDGWRLVVAVAVLVGAFSGFGAYVQTVGLRTTTTSNSAFITSLFVVFTPLIESVVYRRWPRRGIAGAVAVSMLGLWLLTGASLSMGRGDVYTLLCAALYGGWYVAIGAYTNRMDLVAFTCAQLFMAALFMVPFAIASGFGRIDAYVIGTVLFTGIACTAVAFALTAWAQRRIDPSRTTIISLVEPVVAGVVGYVVGERLGVGGYVGASLIIVAILIAERGTHAPNPPAPEV
jgi:drug/metabolite transporter (DMT)-like permease